VGRTTIVKILSKIQNYHFVTLVAWFSRGMQALLQVMILSIVSQLLGVDDYTVYILITSLLCWFLLADLGLGFSLQNKISSLKSRGKSYKEFIATILFIGSILIIIFGVLTWIVSNSLASYYLSNFSIDSDYTQIFFISVLLMICVGVFGMVYKIWYALEKGYWSSIVPAISVLISYLFLLWLQKNEEQSLEIILLAYFGPLAFMPMVFYAYFLFKLRSKISFKNIDIEIILKKSKEFLFFGLMALLVLNVDFFIASQVLSSEEVIQYHILLKIFSLALFIYSAFLMAIWPVLSEKISSKENYHVIEGMVRKSLPVGMLFMIIFTGFIVVFGEYIYRYLIRNIEVNISPVLVVSFGLYFLIRVWTDTFAMILQAGNNLKPLLTIVPIQAFVSVSLQIFLSMKYGVYGLLMGLIISFLCTVFWYLPYSSHQFLKVNAKDEL
jgi:O-antigen/teichoic acid export membrane protein